MKVAFVLNAYNEKVNYRNAEVSNPGIGGTEYLFWTTSYFIKKYYPEIKVYLFAKGAGPFPLNITSVCFSNDVEIFTFCKCHKIDYLIIRGPYIKPSMDQLIKEYKQRTIVWSHNLENFPAIKRLENNPYIVKHVCVSAEQLYWLKDTELYKKSTFIYNGLYFKPYRTEDVQKMPLRVCYIGNLYPRSGIETVAYAWKSIKKKVPDAQLWIIGGNNLYNVQTMQQEYSKKSFKKLQKVVNDAFYSNGVLDNSVHFTGVLRGKEKLEVMASAQVGLANLTDAGDTFGLALVEFQALGVPVVSIGRYGVLETVDRNHTGILVNNKRQIANAVVRILKDEIIQEEMANSCKKFVYNKFDIEKVVYEWKKLFLNVDNFECHKTKNVVSYGLKFFLEINSTLKELRLFHWLPSIHFYKYIKYGLKRILEKLEIM